MRVAVRLFAAARERAGVSTLDVELPAGARVGDLLTAVGVACPALRTLLPHLRVAVNQDFAEVDAPLPPDGELALIPPVAGGSGRLFRVQDAALSLDEVVAAVSGPGQGALVTFTGVVRDASRGQAVTRLDYEAYGDMARRQLLRIGDETEARWPGVRVAVVHRVGTLQPGELAVVIAASAPHRAEAFEACRAVIERLKTDVPIWKKEFGADGETWVGLGP